MIKTVTIKCLNDGVDYFRVLVDGKQLSIDTDRSMTALKDVIKAVVKEFDFQVSVVETRDSLSVVAPAPETKTHVV